MSKKKTHRNGPVEAYVNDKELQKVSDHEHGHSVQDKPGGSQLRKRSCCAIMTSTATLIIALVVVVIVLSLGHRINQILSTPRLGHRDDTIKLQEVNRFYHSALYVSTCDQAGDSAHQDQIYLVRKDNLTIHETSDTFESVRIDQSESSAITGLVDYVYLLADGEIEYTICLGSLSDEHMEGELFVFDDDQKFSQYQEHPELGEKLSVFSLKLEVGKINASNCITIMYHAPKSSYYFIGSRTPGSIFYSFKYTLHIKYLNHLDYKPRCSIYTGDVCEVDIPGHLFSNDEYVLLAYIKPNVEATSVQTHLCVTGSRSDTMNLIIGLSGSIGGVALLVVLIFVVVKVAVCYSRCRNRSGYIPIRSSSHPPPYETQYRHYQPYE